MFNKQHYAHMFLSTAIGGIVLAGITVMSLFKATTLFALLCGLGAYGFYKYSKVLWNKYESAPAAYREVV